MYYRVCTRYCGQPTLLSEFKTEEEAVKFMNKPCVLFSADETDDGEDEIIYPNEMYIETSVMSFYTELYEEREAKDRGDIIDAPAEVSEEEMPF